MELEDLIQARPTRRVHQAAWYRDLLTAGKTHGLSTAELAGRAGLTVATIYNWKRRLSAASPEAQADVANEQQLVRVRVTSEAPVAAQTDGFELRLAHGRSVIVPRRFDQAALASLVEVLGRC